MEKILNEDFKIINIVLKEAIICPLQQSEDELSDYKNIYAPKERYYIPMFLNEKWERNLDNDKYKRLERVDKFLLNKLDNIKDKDEREIYYNTGYELANNYYLVEKNLLREPDPPISDKILLEKKKYDKTGYKNKIFKNLLRNNRGFEFGKKLLGINLGKKNDNFNDKESVNSIQNSNISLSNNNLEKSIESKNSSNNGVNNNNLNFGNIFKNLSNNNNNKNINTIKNNTFFKTLFSKKNKNNDESNINIINNYKNEDSKINEN